MLTPRERIPVILQQCAYDHLVTVDAITGRSTLSEVVAARYDFVRRVHDAIGTSRSHTARATGLDRKTVWKALRS